MAYRTRSPRFQTEHLPLAIRGLGTFAWASGYVLNLSKTGVQIFSVAKLTNGTSIEMEFTTVNRQGKKIQRRIRAKIVWSRVNRYGCQFTPTSKKKKKP